MKKILIIIVLVLMFTGCAEENIKIGFVGDLSTKNSQLAVDARNAVMLGIEAINSQGGVNGKKVQLVIKDDMSDADLSLQLHKEFMEEDVHLILGHLTSNMSTAIALSQCEDMLFFSPSISTDKMSLMDDYFLRSSPINSRQAAVLSDYLHEQSLDKLTVVYDTNNAEYSSNLYQALKNEYEYDGFLITHTIPFDSTTDDLQSVAKMILSFNNESILYISQATDTAYLQQYLYTISPETKIFSVSWSMTKDLIELGGRAIENMIFVGINQPEHTTERYQFFYDAYEEKYSYAPSFISVLAYDGLQVMLQGIEKADSDDPQAVKQAILDIGHFKGLNDEFDIDEYGDNNRQYMLYKLIDANFVPYWQW